MSKSISTTTRDISSPELLEILKELLLSGSVSTQAEIKLTLQKKGIVINQTKISRLLRKLGAIKRVNDRGESSYSLAPELTPPLVQSSLAQLIVDIVANEILIVIHTNPGSAPLIARLLDHQAEELGILGTVAGDDTLFVVPDSIRNIKPVMQAIKQRLS